MWSFQLAALLAALFAASRAIPIPREPGDHVARSVGEYALQFEARDFDCDDAFVLARNRDDLHVCEDDNSSYACDFDQDAFLEARSDDGIVELFARNRGNEAIKAQAQRQEANIHKAAVNALTSQRAASVVNEDIEKPNRDDFGKTIEGQRRYDAAVDARKKAAKQAGSRAVGRTIQDAKADRTAKWDEARAAKMKKLNAARTTQWNEKKVRTGEWNEKTARTAKYHASAKIDAQAKKNLDGNLEAPSQKWTGPKPNHPPGSRAARLATEQANRATTKAEMRAGGQRMKEADNIPSKKDKYEVHADNAKGTKMVTGTDARKAVFAANVNEPRPVGSQRMPKTFNNDPYPPTHPDPTLRDQPVVPGLPAGQGREYPVVSGSRSGWTGSTNVGSARVITQNGAGPVGNDKFHGIIAHDETKGGSNDDHYLIPKIEPPKAKSKATKASKAPKV